MVSSIGSNNSFMDYALFAGSMLVDEASGEGTMIGKDGSATPVDSKAVSEMLAAAGYTLQNGKITGNDKIEKSSTTVNAALSLGAPPPLPAINTQATNSDVSNTVKQLQFSQSVQDSALLMNALLILLRGAEEDRKTNDEIGNVMFKMKDAAKKGETTAGRNKIKADLQTAREQYRTSMITAGVQAVVMAASAATAGAASAVAIGVSVGAAAVNAATDIAVAKHNWDSADHGSIHNSGQADKDSSIYKKMAEEAESVIDITKESGDSCREMWKGALKLLESVAQRATQNVQALTRI